MAVQVGSSKAKTIIEGAVVTVFFYATSCFLSSNFKCKFSCGRIRSTWLNKSSVLSYHIIKVSALFYTYSPAPQRADVGMTDSHHYGLEMHLQSILVNTQP